MLFLLECYPSVHFVALIVDFVEPFKHKAVTGGVLWMLKHVKI